MKKLLLLFIPLVFFFGCEPDGEEIQGCMDPTACNYDPEATEEWDMGQWPTICYYPGEQPNPNLLNNGGGIIGYCAEISEECECCYLWDDIDGDGINAFDYNGNILDDDIDGDGIVNSEDDDIDGDGILNENDDLIWQWDVYICGCMDENACNYDPNALQSNNSCLYDKDC